MRGWQASNTLRANKHYQSGRSKKYKWEKNPFSGYTSDFPLFPYGYSLWNPSKGTSELVFTSSWSAGSLEYGGLFGGLRTGQLSGGTVHNAKEINGCMADCRGTGYGVIHIGATIPESLADVTFTYTLWAQISGFQYMGADGESKNIANSDGRNNSGSNEYVEWHMTGADLNSGYDIYVKFKDKTRLQYFLYPITGYTRSEIHIKTDRALTDDEITMLSSDNKGFLITCASRMITEAEYNGSTTG